MKIFQKDKIFFPAEKDMLEQFGLNQELKQTEYLINGAFHHSIRSLVAAKEHAVNKEILNEIVKEHKSNFLSTNYII